MDWKNEFNGLEEFSDRSYARANKIAHDKTLIVHENAEARDALLNEYSPLVEEVYKHFAFKISGNYLPVRVGDDQSPSIYEIGRVEDIDEFERINVVPDVRLLIPWGVMVGVPVRAEISSQKCERILELSHSSREGFYEYRRQDDEGGWINSKGYFMPFKAFTQQKLAHALAEIYRQAVQSYLKELKG